MTVSQYLNDIKAAGFRLTKARSALVKVFVDCPGPLSAWELQAKLEELGIEVNKTTVYREVEFLMGLGVIQAVAIHSDVATYELTGVHHHHLVCQTCGVVAHIHLPSLENHILEAELSMARDNGFARATHQLEFYGVCRDCA